MLGGKIGITNTSSSTNLFLQRKSQNIITQMTQMKSLANGQLKIDLTKIFSFEYTKFYTKLLKSYLKVLVGKEILWDLSEKSHVCKNWLRN